LSSIDSYTVEELRTMKDLRDIFAEENAERDAWLFLSTEGEHGTTLTLDDLEIILRDQHTLTRSENGRYWITVLVVFPKRVSAKVGPLLQYGELIVDENDLQWLRDKVRETLVEVEASQYGNI